MGRVGLHVFDNSTSEFDRFRIANRCGIVASKFEPCEHWNASSSLSHRGRGQA